MDFTNTKNFKNQLWFLSWLPTLYLPSESPENKHKASATVHCHCHSQEELRLDPLRARGVLKTREAPQYVEGGGGAQPRAPGGLVLISSFFSHHLGDQVQAAGLWAAAAQAWTQGALSGEGALLSQLSAGGLTSFPKDGL